MKIRAGFVANSSSSSYLVAFKQKPNKTFLKDHYLPKAAESNKALASLNEESINLIIDRLMQVINKGNVSLDDKFSRYILRHFSEMKRKTPSTLYELYELRRRCVGDQEMVNYIDEEIKNIREYERKEIESLVNSRIEDLKKRFTGSKFYIFEFSTDLADEVDCFLGSNNVFSEAQFVEHIFS
jgi:hypothetical protein